MDDLHDVAGQEYRVEDQPINIEAANNGMQ